MNEDNSYRINKQGAKKIITVRAENGSYGLREKKASNLKAKLHVRVNLVSTDSSGVDPIIRPPRCAPFSSRQSCTGSLHSVGFNHALANSIQFSLIMHFLVPFSSCQPCAVLVNNARARSLLTVLVNHALATFSSR